MDDAPSSNADRFVRALWPDRYRCLGRRLRPLSIGHLLLLRRLGSPLVLGGTPDAADIALAVFICSRPWRRALAAMRRPWLGIRLIPLGVRASWWSAKAVRGLTAYLRAGMAGPRWWPVHRPGCEPSEMRSPYWLTILVALEAEMGATSDQALDMPVALALWRVAALREREGAIQIVSDEEMAALARSPEPFGSAEPSRPSTASRN